MPPSPLFLGRTSRSAPDRQEIRVDRAARLGAVALTAVAFGVLAVAVADRSPTFASVPSKDAGPAVEHIVFAAPERPFAPPERVQRPAASPVAREVPSAVPAAPGLTVGLDTGVVVQDAAPATTSREAPGSSPAVRSAPTISGVLLESSGLRHPAVISPAERAATIRAIGIGVPSAPRVRPTQEERDAFGRAESRRLAEAREANRPAPMAPGVGIAVGLPGGGPTRAQRLRDSVINAGNLRRLHAIAERAQVADSIRVELLP